MRRSLAIWITIAERLDLLKQATLVELDLSDHALGELPEAIATLTIMRVLRANSMRFSLQEIVVLARGPPASSFPVLSLNG